MPAINVFGSSLSFDARGAGETVIALHPTGLDRTHWTGLAEYLEGRHCVFTPDLPGHGASDAWSGPQRTTVVDEAEMIFELIDRWEEPVHLVGHGYGAALALRIAMRHPQCVRSLTLVDPEILHVLDKASSSPRGKLFAGLKALEDTMKAVAASEGQGPAMAHFVDFWNGHGTWQRTSRELREKLAARLPAVLSNIASVGNESWPLGSVGFVNCPVKLITGNHSPEQVQTVAEMLRGALPNATLDRISGAGHMLTRTHPHVVDPLIAGHIADNSVASKARRFALAA
jgi:pimeloyl-ACP methyl ester carboxylesterase